jgi:hypothetical protein
MEHTRTSGRAATGRRGGAPRLLVTLGASALSLGFLAALAPASQAAAAPAAKGVAYTLTTGQASFKAAGHTWHLQITAGGGALGSLHGTATLNFQITTSVQNGTEEHAWVARLPLAAKDFTLSKRDEAVLSTGSVLSPVAKFSLTFKPSSHTKISCTTGSGTDYAGSVSGSVSLTTGLKGVTVNKRLTFGKPNSLSVESQCVPPEPCDNGGWAGGNPMGVLAGGTVVGTPGRQETGITVERADIKTASKDLVRTDGGYVLGTPAPVFNASAKTLTIKAKSSGFVTGGGRISHATEEGPTTRLTCYVGKQKYTETERLYVGLFAASPVFKVHLLVPGEITAPSSGSGFFTDYSYKKA